MTPPPSPLCVLDWGSTTYQVALARQLELVEERIAGSLTDTLVFTEHEPVFTIGLRSGASAHLVWDEATRSAHGVAVAETNRGGDITYHGPGQVVGYPIIDLSPRRDLHAYLRFLEEVMMASVGRFGLNAMRREGKTGIWVGNRKVAAIGVAVRRWVTYHGFALNVDPNLGHFGGIIPCGISEAEGTVTSLQRELGASSPPLSRVKEVLAEEFQSRLVSFLSGS